MICFDNIDGILEKGFWIRHDHITMFIARDIFRRSPVSYDTRTSRLLSTDEVVETLMKWGRIVKVGERYKLDLQTTP